MGARSATAIVALAMMAFSSNPVPASAEGAGPDPVARALFDAGRQSAELGDWTSAAAYLTEGAVRDPLDSDILYLKAMGDVKTGRPLDEALASLDASLAANRFSFYRVRNASTLKAELLVRERRWQEALSSLGPPDSASMVDPDYYRIRARAFLGSGNMASFVAELRAAFGRFPDDPSFPRLFLAHAGAVPASEGARALGEAILKRLARYSAVDPELPVLAAPLMSDIAAKRDAVTAFRAAGGKSPAATLRALEYGLVDEKAASEELLSGTAAVAERDLASLLALAGSPAGRAAVLSALEAWTGRVDVDADGDGIAEGSFSIEKGMASDWSLETRQDGRPDERAEFADGLPSKVTLERQDSQIEVSYSTYPAVRELAFVGKTERQSYSFAPEAFDFAPIAMRRFAGQDRGSIFFPHAEAVADPTQTACAAAALSVAVDSGSSREVTALAKGVPLAATGYRDGRLYSKTSYDRGRPVLERVDEDGDGRFETERGFVAGPDGSWDIAWVRRDSVGDGIFDYYEQTVFPFRKEWDFDRNGSVDAVQQQLKDGSMEQDFSSRLDGRLDESLILKDGVIVAVSRNGIALPLQPDSNPALTWIGKKGFDIGRNLPAGEGLFTNMGERYMLTRIGSLAFAELVP